MCSSQLLISLFLAFHLSFALPSTDLAQVEDLQPGPEQSYCLDNKYSELVSYESCVPTFAMLNHDIGLHPNPFEWGGPHGRQGAAWQQIGTACRIVVSANKWDLIPENTRFSLALVRRMALSVLARCGENDAGRSKGGFAYVTREIGIGIFGPGVLMTSDALSKPDADWSS